MGEPYRPASDATYARAKANALPFRWQLTASTKARLRRYRRRDIVPQKLLESGSFGREFDGCGDLARRVDV